MFDAKGGERSSMIDLGGAIYIGGAYLLHLVFMCDTLLCIHVYFYALNYIRVIVIVIHTCDRNRDIYVIVIFM